MKVVLVRSSSINPDPRICKEAASIHKAGCDVDIFCWGREKTLPPKEVTETYTIHRFLFQAPLGKKVMFYLPFWWIVELIWLIFHKWDVVHAVDYDTIIPAMIACKLKHKKIVYDICDYFPDRGEIPKLFRNILRSTDKLLFLLSDAVILIDDCKRDEIGKINNNNICVVYNSSDVDISEIVSGGSTVKFTKPTVFYGGSFSKYRDVKSMIKIIGRHPEYDLIIAGYGPSSDVKEIEYLCNQYVNTKYIGKISNMDVLMYTKISHLTYALYDPKVPNNKYASPTKLFDAMMCGTPIITNYGSSTADIVLKAKCGLVVPYGDISALSSAVVQILNQPELSDSFSKSGKLEFTKKYAWSIMEHKLIQLYKSLVK